MKFNNAICYKFDRRINNEIAAGCQFDYITINSLKSYKITDSVKKIMGFSEGQEVTLLDLTSKASLTLYKMRLIYIFSLMEAFFEEYISERDNVNIENIKPYLSSFQSTWTQKTQGLIQSTSFLNWEYVNFVLKEKYNIDIKSVTSTYFTETGPLRNCLVHGGIIKNEDYRINLKNIIESEGIIDKIGSEVVVSDKLVWSYINDARKIIEACDY